MFFCVSHLSKCPLRAQKMMRSLGAQHMYGGCRPDRTKRRRKTSADWVRKCRVGSLGTDAMWCLNSFVIRPYEALSATRTCMSAQSDGSSPRSASSTQTCTSGSGKTALMCMVDVLFGDFSSCDIRGELRRLRLGCRGCPCSDFLCTARLMY